MNKIDRLCRDVKRLVNEAAQGEQFKIAIRVVPAYFSIVSYCYSNNIEEPETLESTEGRIFYSDMLKKLNLNVSEEEFFRYFENGNDDEAYRKPKDESERLLLSYLAEEKEGKHEAEIFKSSGSATLPRQSGKHGAKRGNRAQKSQYNNFGVQRHFRRNKD